jgi:lysozyme
VKVTLKILTIITMLFFPISSWLLYNHSAWRFNYPDTQSFPVQGIDVSHHQGDIDWSKIPKDKVKFAYIKSTEGGDFKDKKFQYNLEEALDNGFRAGAYHFFTLCRDGKTQARNFISSVPNNPKLMPPVIDLEFVGNCPVRPTKEDMLKELENFTKLIENHYGKEPILYITYEFYGEYLKDSGFSSYKFWVRDIFKKPNLATFPEWYIWQYADNGTLPGIDGRVDLNALNPEKHLN